MKNETVLKALKKHPLFNEVITLKDEFIKSRISGNRISDWAFYLYLDKDRAELIKKKLSQNQYMINSDKIQDKCYALNAERTLEIYFKALMENDVRANSILTKATEMGFPLP